MPEKDTLTALSQAVRENRITIDQMTAILRAVEQTPGTSVEDLLKSYGGPSLPPLSGDPGVTVDQEHSSLPATPDGTAAEAVPVDAQLRYQPASEIGRGGLGRVVQAYDLHVGRDVAIKELLPDKAHSTDRIERFFFEARLTGRLEHPAIVPVHAVGLNPEGLPFYAMKLVQGRTLAELIHAYHGLPKDDPTRADALRQLFRALIEVCHAAAFAHSRGVIHRDIKPRNIMVGDFGEVLLVDWGLAKQAAAEHSAPTTGGGATRAASAGDGAASLSAPSDRQHVETSEGSMLGTPGNMSPEQARGDLQHVDRRTDIFALGATLYEILVGHPPYLGPQALAQAQQGQFPTPRELQPHTPAALQAICQKAMAADPLERYESARELADEIARFQAGDPVRAYAEPWYVRTGRWLRRHRTFCVSTAAVCSVLAVAAIAWNVRRSLRAEALAVQARAVLREVQPALADSQPKVANARLTHAEDLVSGEPVLASPHTEVGQLLIQARSRINAYKKYEDFCRKYENAVYQGLFPNGKEDANQAIKAVEEALQSFALLPEKDADPQLAPSLYEKQQIRQIETACRQLRLVYADMHARSGRTAGERRAGARKADSLLAQMRPEQRRLQAFHLRRAWYLSLAGDEAAAAEETRLAGTTPPHDADDFFLVGDVYYRQGNYPAAVEHFQQTLQRSPEHLWAQYAMGVAQIRLERWQEALTSLRAVAARRPDLVNIYLVCGFVYGELDNLEAALRDFQEAQKRSGPHDYGLLINRGAVRLRHKQFALAESDFRHAIKVVPAATAAYLNLAELHQRQEQYPLALAGLSQAIALEPDTPRFYQRRASVHGKMKNDDAALADLQQGLEKAPARSPLWAELHVEQGVILHRQGRHREALAAYDRARAVQGNLSEANRLSGLALAAVGEYREAVARLDKYLAARQSGNAPRPTAGTSVAEEGSRRFLAGVYRERGLARLQLSDPVAAVADFAQALYLAPQAGDFPREVDRRDTLFMLGRLGWAYLLQGPALALPVFDAAVKADSRNADLYAGRAYARVLTGEHQLALADAEQALKLEPENPNVLFNVAGIFAQAYAGLKRKGRTSDARPHHDRALDLLRRGLEKSPAAARSAYLTNVAADPALDPLRDSDQFPQLLAPSPANR